MSGTPDKAGPGTTLAKALRSAAAQQTDPKEASSLLQSAEKVELADRELLGAEARLLASIAEAKSAAKAIRRRDQLPLWAVVIVLVSFFAFLAYVAVKHHA